MAFPSFPKIEGYVVTEKLGSGSYSTVYKAYNKVGGRMTVAIKCVDKGRVKHSGSAVDNLITEIRLMKSLSHPHIVKMHNFTWDDKNIYIIMEYCCGGDLSKYIHRYGRVPEKQVRYFLQQLASALKFLHEKGIVHMDLKPHNLLLHKESTGKYVLKVADFGFAAYIEALEPGGVRGSPLYMAPEVLAREGSGAAADLWSVGVIMYECLFGRAPYSSTTFKELVEKIQRQAPIQIPPNSSISAECRTLLLSLLQHDPRQRISYEDFLSHPYLDLEHMPSPENYEKAVLLIKRAIELDSMGQLQAALSQYTASLRYLVPCVCVEHDKLRRAALTDKLTRYMERAEEIKACLKGGSQQTSQPLTSTSQDIIPPQCNTSAQEIAQDSVPSDNGVVTEELPAVVDTPTSSDTEPDRPRGSRFGFKRLFSRQSLPMLDNQDSSITSPVAQDKQKDNEQNDNCRIS